MIAVIYGTTGELIKLAPLLLALDATDTDYVTLCTGQQPEQIPRFLEQFGLNQPDHWLARGRRGADLAKNTDIPFWGAHVVGAALLKRQQMRRLLRSDGRPSLVIVHGDTLTTILGAVIGRIWGLPVAHVEAGYRSGRWNAPFPEELVRRAVSRLARIHYASGPHTAAHLRREHARGEIVDTGFNTIRDSMELAANAQSELAVKPPTEPFGIVSLHRYELLNNPTLLRQTMDVLSESTRAGCPLLFVDHSVTARAITAAGLDGVFDSRFQRVPRQHYFAFIALLRHSSFLVTDSGGSQQECWQLGHPCLVHRSITEHTDSADGSVVVSGLDFEVLSSFLAGGWRRQVAPPSEGQSPTAIIVAHLERGGFISRERRGWSSSPTMQGE